jgi:hypothetical protein
MYSSVLVSTVRLGEKRVLTCGENQLVVDAPFWRTLEQGTGRVNADWRALDQGLVAFGGI